MKTKILSILIILVSPLLGTVLCESYVWFLSKLVAINSHTEMMMIEINSYLVIPIIGIYLLNQKAKDR